MEKSEVKPVEYFESEKVVIDDSDITITLRIIRTIKNGYIARYFTKLKKNGKG